MHWLFLIVLLGGCVRMEGFACATDADCGGGTCEANGACSFADSACASGRRYGDHSDVELATRCVAESAMGDTCAVTALQAGALGKHTCALREDGRVVCWGQNVDGQLGVAGAPLEPQLVPDLDRVVDLAVGDAHTCALRDDRSVWCWGANAVGQLGDGTFTARATPAPAVISGVIDIASGAATTCARTANGQVWCWGHNDQRQLTGAAGANSPRPIAVPGILGATGIGVGRSHTCAWSESEMRCWGVGDEGQLGNGSFAEVTQPVAVTGMGPLTQASVGDDHSCALSGGGIWCWGDSEFRTLAVESDLDQALPRAIAGLADMREIRASDEFNCARNPEGKVWCWGRNVDGQLGIGETTPYTARPTQVVGLSEAEELALGSTHGCARRAGQVFCWGQNLVGQLGDGSTTIRLTPVAVKLPCE